MCCQINMPNPNAPEKENATVPIMVHAAMRLLVMISIMTKIKVNEAIAAISRSDFTYCSMSR